MCDKIVNLNLNFEDNQEELVQTLKSKIEEHVLTKKDKIIKLLYFKKRDYGIYFNYRCCKYFSCKSLSRKFAENCRKIYTCKFIKSMDEIVIYENSQVCCNDSP